MPEFVDRFSSKVLRLVLYTPVDLTREEWIYIFCGLVLFGYLCLRGMSQRI